MAGYTKLFADIVTSTIWSAPNDQRVLWITLLALKGQDNICRATVPALARMCDLTLENCEKYLGLFQEPDKYSRSQEHEGRRIRAVDGGWFILNGEKYQHLLGKEERKEYNRQKTARFRERNRVRDQKSPALPNVTNNTPSPPATSPSSATDKTQSGQHANARAESGLFVPPNGETTNRSRDADRWPYEQGQPWAQGLKNAMCKVGPENWPAWKTLCEQYPGQVVPAAKGIAATKRWPDAVEEAIKASRGQETQGAVVARKVKVIG